MTKVEMVWLCAKSNIIKWRINPRIYCIAIVHFVMAYWNAHGIAEYADLMNVKTTPWIFPFYVSAPIMVSVYGILTTLLYCDAPFEDGHTPLMIIRMGRLQWILGQLLYIVLAAILYTLYVCMVYMVVQFPHVEFSEEWGRLLKSLAANPGTPWEHGISILALDVNIIQRFSVRTAMGLGLLQHFITTVFMGTMIFCLNMISKRMVGVGTGIFFTFLAYFCYSLGIVFVRTNMIRWFSPVSWVSMSFVDWFNTMEMPSPMYAFIMQSIGILIFVGISIWYFCRKDIQIYTGRRY